MTKEELDELQRHVDERKWPPNKPEERAILRAATRAAEREQREQASVIHQNVCEKEPEQMTLWEEEEND